MALRKTAMHAALAAIAATAATSVFAQGGRGGGGPPVELPPERLVPAENTIDPSYEAPETSWGDPEIQGHWTTDDMRGVNATRNAKYGAGVESLDEADFLQRAQSQERGRTGAEETETFLRNEWGTRTFGFNSLVVEPATGTYPGTTPASAELRNTYQGFGGTFGSGPFHEFTDFSLYDRCIARGINNGTSAAIYGNGIIIAQSPNSVSITYEMIHETRIIPLDSRPHLSPELKQWTGNGRGHWEGDTLVIETMGFDPRINVGQATPSDQMKTTERIRRVDDEMIEYRITYEDPVSLNAPYTMRVMWTTEPGYYVWEYSCHEGNGAVGHSLSGERAWERNVASAIVNGTPVPVRGDVYGAPQQGSEVVDINTGAIIIE
jgi:hypothetical protein